MNKEIIVAYLNEHETRCPYRPVSAGIKKNRSCTLCSHMNRDVSILISKIHGARDTVDVGLAISPKADSALYTPYEKAGFHVFRQKGRSETERIESIFHASLMLDYESVVLVSHNVPNLPPEYIENALAVLRNGQSLVLGPSENGVFYLIGIKRHLYEQMLRNKIVRTLSFYNPALRELSIRTLQSFCTSCTVLPKWYFLKSLDDMKKLYGECTGEKTWKARWTRLIARDLLG
jgi:glycosyltransferase A (GT-A) superfamily protein (DUF2064 family)